MKARRRIRRRVARRAPAVRRCPCVRGGAPEREEARAGGLMIGGAKDPAEAAADARAARALEGAPPVRRKCAACAEEDRMARRSAPTPAVAPGAAAAPAPRSAKTALSRLGPGRPLTRPERAFYEPRLGADLSAVRLHDGEAADRAARAMDAAAFTLGRDVAFARGARARLGPSLLAHELAHVAGEGDGFDARRAIRRRIDIHKPAEKIPNPGGKGVDQTNAETVQQYLDKICPYGTPKVSSGGSVEMGLGECILPDQLGSGCGCICELDEAPVTVTIHVRDEGMNIAKGTITSPHTMSTGPGAETGKGAGSDVVVPSPNDTVEYGYADVSGAKKAYEPWQILAHELCGHARLGARGTHPFDAITKEVRHGHETVVAMENAITGLSRGVGPTAPYCGESFKREKGETTFEDESAKHLRSCEVLRWWHRQRLIKLRKRMPKEEREKLPPIKKKYDISEPMPEK